MAADAYSIGSNWAPSNPSFALFQVLSTPPPAVFSGKSYYDTTQGIGVYANGQWNYTTGGGGGAVSSVFGRTGDITAQSGDYTFAQISGKPSTIQFMWVVGGNNNFSSITSAPAVPGVGSTTLITSLLTGVLVRVYRNGLVQMGLDPGDGDTFYTKVTASNTLTFSPALLAGERIIVETIPL